MNWPGTPPSALPLRLPMARQKLRWWPLRWPLEQPWPLHTVLPLALVVAAAAVEVGAN